jgi:FAD/FMN-containing dehydrogenase
LRDANALQRAIAGEVVLPDAPGYEELRRPAMARFRDVRPQAVVRCAAAEDVTETLAAAAGTEVVPRSGGHCFAGRSSTTGIVIDVGPIDHVAVSDGVAAVGAGTRLGGLYDALAVHGLTVAAGCGPAVGIAGLMLCGGLGILGRSRGLTSDQLVAAEVVLADGRVVRCDEHHEPDLLWALRGAGGCQAGVVTELVLKTLPAPDAMSFELRWPPEAAGAVIAAWQEWAPDAPDEIAASLLVTAGDELLVRVPGAMIGSDRSRLDGLVARAGVDPSSATFRELPYREAKRHLAERDAGTTAESEPGAAFAKSEFFRTALPADAIAALVEHVGGEAEGYTRELDFTPMGGAYNRVPPDATGFVHRAERFLLKHEVVVDDPDTQAARRWLRRSWEIVRPWGSGGVYPNFPDADLAVRDRAYHGANLERLLRVRAHYGADGVFSR